MRSRPPAPPAPARAGAVLLAAALCAGPLAPPARPADPESPQVKKAIADGVAYLRKTGPTVSAGGYQVLCALAMVKGGAPKDDPFVRQVVQSVRGRAGGGAYKPDRDHMYTAGLELMLLEAAGDAEKDRATMEPILAYLRAEQRAYGAWFYPNQPATKGEPDTTFGDTSISQYAVLGLWTAERAGLKVETDRWNALAKWQVATRGPGGAFYYHPQRGGTSGQPRDTMTAAGACNLLLAARYLHGDAALDAEREKARAEAEAAERAAADAKNALLKKYAAFDRRPSAEEQEAAAKAKADGGVVSLNALTGTADASIASISKVMQFRTGSNRLYYLYTLERLGALSGRKTFGPRDWYEEGSEFLLKAQKSDGSWDGEHRLEVGTAFAVMFLAKATAKALGQPRSLYGGGLLKGGRGLPDDLTQARFNGEGIEFDRPTGDLADLLTRLEDPAAANVPAARDAVLETVRTGDREALVGQTARLRRLIEDPRPEVRAVVLWALARSGGPEDVEGIFKRLSQDPDVGVVREAHNALSVLSRLPRGPSIPLAMPQEEEFALERLADRDLPPTYVTNGRLRALPGGPFEGLPAGLTEAEQAQAFADWRGVAVQAWATWRDAVRPYEQRDLQEAPKLR